MLPPTEIHRFNPEPKLGNLASRVQFFIVAMIPGKSIQTSVSISLNMKYI